MDTTEASLLLIFPDTATSWTTERAVIQNLIKDGELWKDLVNLLDKWLPETPFQKVFLQHPRLTIPLVYERGEGEEPFLERLRAREIDT